MILGFPSWWIATGLFGLFVIIEASAVSRADRAALSTRRFATNFSMPLLASAISTLVPLSAVTVAMWAEKTEFGLLNLVAASPLAAFAIAVLTRSFLDYWLHRASHRWRWLWRIHRVHHSDRFFDVTLALRHHPFEALVAIAFYAPASALLGLPAWTIIAAELLMVAAAYWEHLDLAAPAWVVRWLHPVLTVPQWHRVHHSARQIETDSNFGTLLVVWDRLFGTNRPIGQGPVERIGLGDEEDRRSDRWLDQLASPFRR